MLPSSEFPNCPKDGKPLQHTERGVIRCPDGHEFYWERTRAQLVEIEKEKA